MAERSFLLAHLRTLLEGAGLLAPPPPGGAGEEEGAVQAGGPEGASPASDVRVTGVSQDSRGTRPGDLFVAWAGAEFDGHDFVGAAAERGAVAAVVERSVPGVPVPQVVVTDGRRAAALLADALAGSPWRSMTLVAVTGTNGKTTTALLVRHLLAGRGPAASIGTLGLVDPDGGVRPGTEGLTTPGPVQLSAWLRQLADAGVGAVAMEASSHALDQHRLDGLRFRAAVFTNLTQDHLDYHGSMEAYRSAKLRLAELLVPGGVLVVNAAEPAWTGLAAGTDGALLFAVEGAGTPVGNPRLRAREVRLDATESRFRLAFDGAEAEVRLPLPAPFNVENALAAAGVGLALGMTLPEVAARLGSAPQVPGRLEVVTTEPVRVLIDFAHTPEALERVLDALRPLVEGRLLVVFGAGGDRDRTKRPRMGAAVERRADLAIVTSDNPRTEDPERIVDDIVAGMTPGRFERIVDRRRAIARALEIAGPLDLVVLAGKGHERTQTIGREKLPFDERLVVRDLLGGRAA